MRIPPDCWSLPDRLDCCQLVMNALTHSQDRAEKRVDKPTVSSGMRLMCSRDPAEIEALRGEFLKAGIAVATRNNPVAESLGISGVELWVTHERDFFTASKLFAEVRGRTTGKCGGTKAPLQAEGRKSHHLDGPEPGTAEPPNRGVNGSESRHTGEPQREELEQASSLLEKEIDEMLKRETELVTECASLRSKLEDIDQALAEARAALARETESRAAAEREQAEKLSGLESALEHERQEWQRQLKSRDDALMVRQKQLEAKSQLLQTHQAAIVELRDAIVALEQQRSVSEEVLSGAREEAAMEREARQAAEERARAAAEAQKSLEKQLLEQKDLEQRMRAHIASIGSLCSKLQAKRVTIV